MNGFLTLTEKGVEIWMETRNSKDSLTYSRVALASLFAEQDAEEAFRMTAAEVCEKLDADIVTVLERNDWQLPNGSTFDIRRMPVIHLEAARVEYESEDSG